MLYYSLKESIKKCQKEIDNKLYKVDIDTDKIQRKKERLQEIIRRTYNSDVKKLELILKALNVVNKVNEEKIYEDFEKKIEQGTVTLDDIKLFSKSV